VIYAKNSPQAEPFQVLLAGSNGFRMESLPMLAAANDIVNADLVMIGQPNQKIYGDRSDPLFVSPVYLTITAQQISNILLGHVMVNSQVL
jgi:hypothetical protein